MDKILIVDDVAVNRRILLEILKEGYEIIEAEDGAQALAMAYDHAESLALVLLDIVMPGPDGYEVLRQMKASRATRHIPVILISSLDSENSESRGLAMGAIDYITKPFNTGIVKQRVGNHVALKRYQDRLQEMAGVQAKKILHMRESVFDAVASIVECRNLESGKHVRRIRLYCEAQLEYLLTHHMYPNLLDRTAAEMIARASTLHDIGKVGIPDRILTKPGRLTPEEYEIMKTHSAIGSNFIDSLTDTVDEDYILYARQICRHHHERWDGKGYPDGLARGEIPLAARIAAIADVYDALVSRRVYKPPYPLREAALILLEGKGTQFDPDLIDIFSKIIDDFEQIAAANRDDAARP